MKLRTVFFLLLAVGMSTCCGPDPSDQAEIEKEKLANGVLHKVAARLKKEADLSPMGIRGQMHYEIEKLGLSFCYYKSIDIQEGRKLLVKAVNLMLEEVNQEKRLHPYLCQYPFLPRNIEIDIFLYSPDGRDIPQGNLLILRANEKGLQFKIDNPVTHRFTTIYRETFEQALERIDNPSLALVPFEPDPEISQDESARLRKSISYVGGDGSIWHLGENGSWVQDPQSVKSKK